MRTCRRCLMPDTRPGSIFDSDGVCLACRNYDKLKLIDWNVRFRQLQEFVKPHPRIGVAISGGKDSYFLAHLVTKVLKKQAAYIRISDALGISENGRFNLQNLLKQFPGDFIEFTPDLQEFREAMRDGFERQGNFPFIDSQIYGKSIGIARAMGLPILLFGEDPGFYYGTKDYEQMIVDDSAGIEAIYTSFFVPWSGYSNYLLAKLNGFKDLEWERTGHLPMDTYDSIDLLGWGTVSNALKYRKFGYGRATDIASRLIREGRMTRQEAIPLVNQQNGEIDERSLQYFLEFCGYSRRQFNEILNQYWNQDIFVSVDDGFTMTKKKEFELK